MALTRRACVDCAALVCVHRRRLFALHEQQQSLSNENLFTQFLARLSKDASHGTEWFCCFIELILLIYVRKGILNTAWFPRLTSTCPDARLCPLCSQVMAQRC
jgi:hypothetical protein